MQRLPVKRQPFLFASIYLSMQILVTGVNGFLGYYLTAKLLKDGHRVIATGRGKCRLPFSKADNFIYCPLDFTNAIEVLACFEKHKPDVVVHAGAISRPDECELNKELAFSINVKGTENLLAGAYNCKSFFIFISTDFVFDGKQGMYMEDDKTGPVNYYGQTKAEAEALVKQYAFSWSIVRTVLVYGKPVSGRDNILTRVKQKLEMGEEYKVVSDQLRTPTYIEDLVAAIAAIINKQTAGVFHIAGADVMTPYEMACRTAAYLKLDASLLKKVTGADFNEPARRPLKTGFNIEKAKRELGYNPISFDEGLQKTFIDQK